MHTEATFSLSCSSCYYGRVEPVSMEMQFEKFSSHNLKQTQRWHSNECESLYGSQSFFLFLLIWQMELSNIGYKVTMHQHVTHLSIIFILHHHWSVWCHMTPHLWTVNLVQCRDFGHELLFVYVNVWLVEKNRTKLSSDSPVPLSSTESFNTFKLLCTTKRQANWVSNYPSSQKSVTSF